MRALITGVSGFVGSHLAKKLIYEGNEVTGVDNLSTGKIENHKFSGLLDKDFLHCSFASPEVLKKIGDGKFDVVFHLAALPRVKFSIDYPTRTTRVNVLETVRLYEACFQNVKRIVFASSSSVYGNSLSFPTKITDIKNPLSPYALQKSFCEDISKMFGELHGLDIVNLRFFNVFGSLQTPNGSYATVVSAWCNAIKNNLPLILEGDGTQSRDMTYVDNVVDACLLAASSDKKFKGECFNVACGKSYTLNHIMDQFEERFFALKKIQAPRRLGDMNHSLADISETKKVLGYEPKVDFKEGLQRTFEWWEI